MPLSSFSSSYGSMLGMRPAERTPSMMHGISGPAPARMVSHLRRIPGKGMQQEETTQLLEQPPEGWPEGMPFNVSNNIALYQDALRRREMANSFMGGAKPEAMSHGGPVNKTSSMMGKNAPLYRTNEEGVEAFQPKGGEPLLIEGGEQIRTFPTDGRVIPADRTAKLMRQGKVAGALPSGVEITSRKDGGEARGNPNLHPHGMRNDVERSAPEEDTRAKVSAAGRTGGLSQFYQNQARLDAERAAASAIDPVSGLSQTPTEREINDQLAMLAAKGGDEGLRQLILMQDYFNAKRSENPQALAEATRAVMDYKHQLNAQRGQNEGAPSPVMNAPTPTTMGRTAGLMSQVGGPKVTNLGTGAIYEDGSGNGVKRLVTQYDRVPNSGWSTQVPEPVTQETREPDLKSANEAILAAGDSAPVPTQAYTPPPQMQRTSPMMAEAVQPSITPSLLPNRRRGFDDSLGQIPPPVKTTPIEDVQQGAQKVAAIGQETARRVRPFLPWNLPRTASTMLGRKTRDLMNWATTPR